jgi:hypothetical protein
VLKLCASNAAKCRVQAMHCFAQPLRKLMHNQLHSEAAQPLMHDFAPKLCKTMWSMHGAPLQCLHTSFRTPYAAHYVDWALSEHARTQGSGDMLRGGWGARWCMQRGGNTLHTRLPTQHAGKTFRAELGRKQGNDVIYACLEDDGNYHLCVTPSTRVCTTL